MNAKRKHGLPTGRQVVTIGYIAAVVAGLIYLKNEEYIGPLDIGVVDIVVILGVLSIAFLSAITSLVFSRATSLKDRTKAAARAAGWGALAAGGFILIVLLAFAAIWGVIAAWGERSQ